LASRQSVSSNLVRFGDEFELDLGAYELRRAGRRLRLARIPMELLLLLLEQPGQLVTREQIAERIWGKDVFLDIDNGINAVVRRIRQVLEDDPEQPRFIETVVGRGYRFIATIQEPSLPPAFLSAVEAQPREGDPGKKLFQYRILKMLRRINVGSASRAEDLQQLVGPDERNKNAGRPWRIGIAAGSVILLIALSLLFPSITRRFFMPQSRPQPTEVVPLTALPGQEISPSFSPDGSQVAFGWDGETNGEGFDLYIKVIGTDKPLRLTRHPAAWLGVAWSPDGRYIAMNRLDKENGGIFLVPALGGPERKLTSTLPVFRPLMAVISWSPDGKQLAFVDHRPSALGTFPQLFLLSIDTLERKAVETGCSRVIEPGFAPVGDALAYICIEDDGYYSLNLRELRGGKSTRLFGGLQRIGGTSWTRDGAHIIFSYNFSSYNAMAGGDLWQFTPGRTGHLEKMQFGHDASSPVTSSSGNRLAYVQSRVNENIWRVDLDAAKAHAHKLLTSTREENGPNISPDGKKIVFVSNRAGSGEIWVCDSDGANARQLTSFGGALTGTPRWSPDGKQIAFDSRAGGEANIYLVDAAGGAPRKLETGTRVNSLPSWSHDGGWLYFVNAPAGSSPTVWRVAAAGGHAVQLTKTAEVMPIESPDGRYVYLVRNTEGKFRLWRIRPDGSGEEMVNGMPPLGSSGSEWWPVQSGIYFYGNGAGKPEVDLLDLRTSRIRRIYTPDKPPEPWGGGFAVSPDGKWLLYSRIDETASDLMLVENFR
jgi:Tol biopolymer transport system component/DNA-binding winged helix-turn-helix (wHTH) protein